MSDQDRNGSAEWHQHMLDQQELEEADEDMAFATAVAMVSDYLYSRRNIPREITLAFIFSIAGPEWETTLSDEERKSLERPF